MASIVATYMAIYDQFLSKYVMLGFTANGRISGPPVFCSFTRLESISGARDPSPIKDLAETHLVVHLSSNFDRFLIPIDHELLNYAVYAQTC